MEKAVTTPDQYPLTLNALTNACNQKSSRQPIMNLEQGDVQNSCRLLKDRHLVIAEEIFRNNSEKYSQRLCNTLLGEYKFNPGEYAIVCLLLLRGPQTPGELRSRSGRLHSFDDNQQVVDTLKGLMERDGDPAVARLPRKAGRQDHEYAHLFAGDVESSPEEATVARRAPISDRAEEISQLHNRVSILEKALTDLAARLGEEIDLTQIDE